jgi:hypothetical protein
MLSKLGALDFDRIFMSDPDAKVIPCGSVNYTSPSQAEEALKELFREDNGDLEFAASCECGHTSGNFFIGHICQKCNKEVTSSIATTLKFRAWLEIPSFMPPILHPSAYRVFRKWLGMYKGRHLLDVILDVDSDVPSELRDTVGLGFVNFYTNFDKVVNYFLNEYKPLKLAQARERAQDIPQFIELYKHCLFVRHVPVLNRNLHVITKSSGLSFADESSSHIFKALIELSNLSYIMETSTRSHHFVESHIRDMYKAYIEYTESIIYDKLAGKPGYVRKYIMGSRCHYSFRGVIVPITGEHQGDELHLPWRIGVASLKMEIMNILMHRKNNSLVEAMDKLHKANIVYDPEIDKIMETLIEECPYKGLPAVFGRNPSLNHGSLLLLFVTKIKKDLSDNTIGFSNLCVGPPNADLKIVGF